MTKYLKYVGWLMSFILLILFIFTVYGTNASHNAQLKAQSDNFTASLVVQGAQRDAQWQANLNTAIAERNATWNATMNAALNAAIAERNTTWNATLASTTAQRDAYWMATMNSTLTSATAQRDAYWQSILEQREAQWRAFVANLQGT